MGANGLGAAAALRPLGRRIEHSSCAASQRLVAPPHPASRPAVADPIGAYDMLSMHDLRDFRPDLQSAIEQLHLAGYDGEAYVLAASMEGAYATALEMVAAIGGAVLRVEQALGADIPREVQSAFRRAMAEVRKAVPALN